MNEFPKTAPSGPPTSSTPPTPLGSQFSLDGLFDPAASPFDVDRSVPQGGADRSESGEKIDLLDERLRQAAEDLRELAKELRAVAGAGAPARGQSDLATDWLLADTGETRDHELRAALGFHPHPEFGQADLDAIDSTPPPAWAVELLGPATAEPPGPPADPPPE